jgi:type IX secretion system PorP/SprF family membrane protein
MSFDVSAQINPMAAQYFQNTYLANPAMTGVKQGIFVNLGYRTQWSNIEGSPQNISATGEYGTEKVGLGFNFYEDEAGLLTRSKLQASYAYHLPLNNDEKKLHFGISLGLQTNSLNLQKAIGSPNDLIALRFNDQENIVDGDFGLGYSDKNLMIEGSITNLKNQLEIEDDQISNYATFMTAISYNIAFSDWQLQPKVVYRGVKNFKNILDMGLELRTYNGQLNFMSMYHTNQSMSFGLTFNRRRQWQLLSLYNTPVKALKSYAVGTFEIGLQFKIRSGQKNDEFLY